MAEQPFPCPHCQGTDLKIAPRKSYDGGGFVLTCQNGDCIARIWGHDESDVIARWNRRTAGPATRAMIEWLKLWRTWLEGARFPDSPGPIFQAFLAECPEPTCAVDPTPDTGTITIEAADEPEQTPWKCVVCGKPVRLTNDLQPWHLDGPANHEAELSREELKTLADGLRMSD